jgi:type II secretory pathway component PulL
MTNMPPVQTPTLKSHLRQRFWQILLPIILVVLLAIVAAVFSTLSDTEHIECWAEISTIWLVAPLMFSALLCMAMLGGMIYAVARLTQITPRYTLRAQNFALRLTAGVKRGADAAVKPVVWLEQARAALKSLFK